MLLRFFFGLVGAGLLAAAAYVNIDAAGGFGEAHAKLVMATAGGVAAGAIALGTTWGQGRYVLAVIFAAALVCGELFGLMQTGERQIEAREKAQAPVRAVHEARASAQERVSAIEVELAALTTTPRLEVALAAKTAADQAVIDQASLRGCARNCRKLLTAQVEAAANEVAAARSGLEAKQNGVRDRLKQATAALTAIRFPASKTGLADRLGSPPWLIDLINAALLSFSVNVLGCALLAFAAHNPSRPQLRPVKLHRLSKTDKDVMHIELFFAEQLEASRGYCLPLSEVQHAYPTWCQSSGAKALPEKRAGQAMLKSFAKHDAKVREIDGALVVFNVALRSDRKAIEDLRAAA